MGTRIIRLPDVGEGVAEAEVVEWHVTPGQSVVQGQNLVDVMTDKATIEVPSPIDGQISWLAGEPGDLVAVGAAIVQLTVDAPGDQSIEATPHEHHDEPAAAPPAMPSPEPVTSSEPPHSPPTADTPRPMTEPPSTATAGERPLAAPAVRRRALELGIELADVAGTGPAGRIGHEDLDRHVAAGARIAVSDTAAPGEATGEVESIKVIGLRRTIARRLQSTWQRIPHITYVEEVDVTDLEALRNRLNADRAADQPKLTMLPFLIRAIVLAVADHPEMNTRYDEEAGVAHRHHDVHMGIATQTDTGLVVPVVADAHTRTIWGNAAEILRLAEAVRSGSVDPGELQGSTISITSLGPLGGIVTTPLINAPEVAIVGVNKIVKRPVYVGEDLLPRKMMNLSSSFDHRLIDGADAASFIGRIRDLLQQPALLFVDRR